MKENVAVPSSPISPSSVPVSTAPSESAPVSKSLWRKWPLLLAGAVVALCVVGGGVASGAYSKWATGDLIAPGVAIAGVQVGGLTKSEAQAELDKRFGRLFVALKTDDRPFNVSLKELGGSPAIAFTVEKAYQVGRNESSVANFMRVYGAKTAGERFMLPMQWSKGPLVAKLVTINHLYATAPKDAHLSVDAGGVEVQPETLGKSLNIGETALQIQKKYFVGVKEITAATKTVAPKLVAADLAGQDVEMGHYTTRFNAGLAGRTTNIHVACSVINGKVLMPGEAFSFNSMTGERTFDKGYRMAHIFERKPGETESEVVDGLAGGVCQVSSTLFNAVRDTNSEAGAKGLKILERNTHSLPVTYVPKGLDATVAWPGKDFRFRNNFAHPVFLKTTLTRSHLTISIMGRVPDAAATQSEGAQASDGQSADSSADQNAASDSSADGTLEATATPSP